MGNQKYYSRRSRIKNIFPVLNQMKDVAYRNRLGLIHIHQEDRIQGLLYHLDLDRLDCLIELHDQALHIAHLAPEHQLNQGNVTRGNQAATIIKIESTISVKTHHQEVEVEMLVIREVDLRWEAL